MGGRRLAGGLKNAQDVGSGDTCDGGINGSVEDCSIATEDEDGRYGDPTLFAGIVDAPLLDHAFAGVAENREGQAKVVAQGCRLGGRIDGNGNYVRAGRADFIVVCGIVRQLAEAEGSPIAAVKEEDERILRDEFGKASRLSRGIGQFKVGGCRSRFWRFGERHREFDSWPVAKESDFFRRCTVFGRHGSLCYTDCFAAAARRLAVCAAAFWVPRCLPTTENGCS
jgi:hypothetical protein